MKALALLIFSFSLFAQEAPLGDLFFIKGGISSRKWFIEQNKKRLEEFPVKYSKIAEEKAQYEAARGVFDKKIAELKAKQKLSKQEKALLTVSSCLGPVMAGKPKKGSWGVDSVHTCAYTSNIDDRLLRQTPSGKPLGEEKDIIEQGDELSKFYLYIKQNVPSDEKFKKFKEYENALSSKNFNENDNVKMEKEIEAMEIALVKRQNLEAKVDSELMKCKTPMTLPLENHSTKISENGSSELMRDFFDSSVKDTAIIDESFAEHSNSKVTSGWSNLMTYGFCFEEKKKEIDCADCQMKIEEKLSQMEMYLNQGKPKKDCLGKMFNATQYRHLYVDHTPTGLSVDNKDRKKGLEYMRKIVMTNLAQGLPVGAKRMDKYDSIIAVKPVKNECHYQVKNYSNGETFWIEEESMFEYLKELTQLNRRY